MRSRVIRLLQKTAYDFGGLQAGQSVLDVPLAQNIDVSGHGGGTLMVRVHAVTLQTESYFRIDARIVAPTDDDPATVFRERTVATVVGHQNSVTAPSLLHGRLAAGTGAYISVFLSMYQDKVGTGSFTISVDLLLEDQPEDWNPSQLGSKLTLWLDQRDLVLVSTDYSDWGDQSGHGNSFTQATSWLRPKTGKLINYFAVPDFDGTDDTMGGATLSDYVAADAYHVFAVLRAESASGSNITPYLNNGVIADAGLGWWGLYLKGGGGSAITVHGFHWDNSQTDAVASGLTTDMNALIEWSYDGATVRCQVGSYPIATAAGNGNIGALGHGVQLGYGASGSLYLDGVIASVIVCNAHLSSAEARSVRDYLSSKYGVTS